MTKHGLSVAERLALYYEKGEPNECWLWKGSVNPAGYGTFNWPPHQLAHRVSWAIANPDAEMPSNLDHMCHTRACKGGNKDLHRRCINPNHLRPSSARDNTLRGHAPAAHHKLKTMCVHGHSFTPENTMVITGTSGQPWRVCRDCRSLYYRAHKLGISLAEYIAEYGA